MMTRTFLTLLTVLLLSTFSYAQPKIIFHGKPKILSFEAGVERTAKDIDPANTSDKELIITESNGKYYWSTRENTELIRTESGAYTTYIAVNGSGYIRINNIPFDKRIKFIDYKDLDYMEHMLQFLTTYTYYGNKIMDY